MAETIINAQGIKVDRLTGRPVIEAGGIGTYGTYSVPGTTETIGVDKAAYDSMAAANTLGLAEQGWMSKVGDWFKPQGTAGTSTGGNILGAIGTGVDIGTTGLAGYFTYKNHEAQKEQQERANKIQDKALARVDNMQKNYDASTRAVG